MIRLLVLNTAAEYGGALTVLASFIKEAEQTPDIDFTILISNPTITSSAKNVHIELKEWVKTSWFHRLYFEVIYLNVIYPLNTFDSVVSLQNTLLAKRIKNQKKYTLLHQSVQFYEGSINFFKKEGLKIFLRKYLIGSIIKLSVKNSDIVFTQTLWMKERLSQWMPKNNIKMVSMNFRQSAVSTESFDNLNWNESFVFPAHAGYLKNHDLIIDALIWLKKKDISLPKIYFTLEQDENKTAIKLYKKVIKNDLPIYFTGTLSQEELFEYYKTSVVLFPSEIETFGLPLLEARNFNTPIISIDKPYAKEVLSDYPNAHFFHTSSEAALLIERMLNGETSFNVVTTIPSHETLPTMIEFIKGHNQ